MKILLQLWLSALCFIKATSFEEAQKISNIDIHPTPLDELMCPIGSQDGCDKSSSIPEVCVILSQNSSIPKLPANNNTLPDIVPTTKNDLPPSTATNTISDGFIHDLGLENFYSVISTSSFTFVLFYDANEDKKTGDTTLQRKRKILQQLANEFSHTKQPRSFFLRNLSVKFATLDTRRHHFLRRVYLRWENAGVGEAYENFYRSYNDLETKDEAVPPSMINSTTFMALTQDELPTFPSEWGIFHGDDFNLINVLDSEEKIQNEPINPLNYTQVRTWLVQQIQNDVHFAMEGPGLPRLAFGESKKGPRAAISSMINREKSQKRKYKKKNAMDTIDWDKVDEMSAIRRRDLDKERHSRNSSIDASVFTIKEDKVGDTFFKFRFNEKVGAEHDAEILENLSNLIGVYLAWTNSYENLWDEDRRAAEDERVHYGKYLMQMNEQVRDALFSVFHDIREEEDEDLLFPLLRPGNVPNLERYFENMIFGFGRSPTSLEAYLQDHVLSRNPEDIVEIELWESLRDYMLVRERVGGELSPPYQMYLRAIWIRLASILAEFQLNLTQQYLHFLKMHPKEREQLIFPFAPIDVFDMKDPQNFALLSDYDMMQKLYVAQRKPFILSNVEMTKPFEYTLDFLVERCGHVDVTKSVQQSMSLGDASVKTWGGLQSFELPRELMTSKREKSNDEWDESISLEQFVALAMYFDDIYLHDFGLKTKCSSLFWKKTPYDPFSMQYFRIPAVIGSYDMFQKLPESGYANSWPSLFVGRKGSNSKLHIDSGSTGFWMYLISGRKRWIIYDEAERPFLYERIEQSSFIADVLALNMTQNEKDRAFIHEYFNATYPLLSRASASGRAYEIIQEAGDLVYIPPNSPHAVENLEDIIGMSFNQVPKSGIFSHLHNLIHDKREFDSVEIMMRFLLTESERAFATIQSNKNDPLYTTFGEYLAQ